MVNVLVSAVGDVLVMNSHLRLTYNNLPTQTVTKHLTVLAYSQTSPTNQNI